jgi:hypothetical protein
MNKGYVVLAQNTEKTNYIECAEALALSIRNVMPNADITLITDDVDDSKYFDKVIALPYGDLAPDSDWKLINDWQVYEASPYEYTIKLEADLYIPKSIDYWWEVLQPHDVVVSTTIRNFRQEISDCRVYRRFIDNNKLPDTYNAITYFKKSDTAKRFFEIVRDVFEHYDDYKGILQADLDDVATTDWAYAIASHIIGVEKTTLPSFTNMSMIHMKQFVNNQGSEDWTDQFLYELSKDSIRINTFPQYYPFHYNVKSFAKKLKQIYG